MSLRIVLTFITVLAFALPGCGLGDDGYQCGRTGPTLEIESGTYLLDEMSGDLLQGPASDGTVEIDRDNRRVTLTYTNAETGQVVVETYEMKSLDEVQPAATDNPSGFPRG